MIVGKRPYLTQLTIWLWHLYVNKILVNYCRRTNGTTLLNLVDHDSMSGEDVWTTSGLIVTSGKSVIWPLVAPENHGFRKLWKLPMEGKSPRQINKYDMWGGRMLPSMLGRKTMNSHHFLLLWALLDECQARGMFWEKEPHTHSPPPLSVVGVSNISNMFPSHGVMVSGF